MAYIPGGCLLVTVIVIVMPVLENHACSVAVCLVICRLLYEGSA